MADEPTRTTGYSRLDWRLESLDGVRPGAEVTLNLLEADRVFGQGPCNSYSAPLTRDGAAIRLGAIAATRMACPDLALEAAYFAALQAVDTMKKTAGSMWLRGGGHELHFVQPVD